MQQFTLADQHVESFQADGYVMARGLFDREELQGVLAIANADAELMGESYVRKDATGGQSRLTVRNDLDETSAYAAIVRSRRIVDAMERLLDDEVYHYHHKMMLKEPRVGGAWEWHQDYGYWYNNGLSLIHI